MNNKMTIIIGCLALVLLSCTSNNQSSSQSNRDSSQKSSKIIYESNLAKYQQLRAEFEIERQKLIYSDTHAYWDGPAGRKIISMGYEAIPFLIQELQKDDFFFIVPLEKITGIYIDGSSEQEKMKSWLNWWLKNKSNPKWNIYL